MIRVAAAGIITACAIVGLIVFSSSRAAKEPLTLRPLLLHGARPSKVIAHEVEWKSGIGAVRRESLLTGPRMYAAEIDRAADASTAILFSWYDLPPSPQHSAGKDVRVSRDNAEGIETFDLGEACYFLSRTQQLNEGTPAEIPDGLSQFVAYEISNASSERQTRVLNTSAGEQSYEIKRPVFLCVPAEQWHHDEYFAVRDTSACWLVYEIEANPHTSSISTLDQFGLNELELGAVEWLCVPARTLP